MSTRRGHSLAPPPRAQPPRSADELLVVLSDIELGAGGVVDDFPQSDWLGELLLEYCRGAFKELPVTLVMNGDSFDFLKTSVSGAWPIHVDAAVALAKLERIVAAHRPFFAALREFVGHARAPRRLVFVMGNHDAELCLPEVQAQLRRLLGDERGDAIVFPGLSYTRGDVHFEHGCQADPLFTFDRDALTVEHDGRTLLNLPWGSIALLEVATPLSPLLYHHDRLKPRNQLLELMPELKRLLLGAFWRYWTRDYWQRYFAAQDRRMSWTMLREVPYRLAAGEMDVNLGDTYRRLVQADERIRVCVVGHVHEAAWFSSGRKKLLQTGCIRNEFALLDRGQACELLPKVYAEIYMAEGHALRSHLVEVDAPPPPPGYVPESIFGVTTALRNLLESRSGSTELELDACAQRELEEARVASSAAQPWSHRFDFVRTLQRSLSLADPRRDRS